MTIALEPRGEDRDGRPSTARRIDARARQDEPLGRPRVPDQLPGPPPRHGAAAADERRTASCSCTSRRSTGSRTIRRCRCRRRRRSPAISSRRSATTARWAGPKPPGRSTKGAWTSRRSWTTSTRRSTTARRSSSTRLDGQELGPPRRRHRVDRSRAAHDVAAHRPRSTRCTTRRSPPSSATRSCASTGAPISSSARCCSASSPAPRC